MITLLLLLVANQHVSFGVNHQLFAGFKIGESWVLNVTLLHIIILEAALTLVEVPEFFFRLLTKIKTRVLKIFFVD